jgi:hypothetical protein
VNPRATTSFSSAGDSHLWQVMMIFLLSVKTLMVANLSQSFKSLSFISSYCNGYEQGKVSFNNFNTENKKHGKPHLDSSGSIFLLVYLYVGFRYYKKQEESREHQFN